MLGNNKNVVQLHPKKETRQFTYDNEGMKALIEQIARTPVEPGLLQAMNLQLQTPLSFALQNNRCDNVLLFRGKS